MSVRPIEQELIVTTLQNVADRTIDAAKAFYDDARRRVEEFADNADAALQARLDAARLGLGGRIRR